MPPWEPKTRLGSPRALLGGEEGARATGGRAGGDTPKGGEARGTAGGLRGGIAGRHSGVDHGLPLQARCVHTAGGRAARRGGAERNGGGGGQRQAQDSAAGTHARMACGEHR
eukprot:scaffold27521_cov62-Phaeocystis_antarctica.AAC.3